MSDIRKRAGKKGVTYQVRYSDPTSKSGYAYATFNTMKEARAFRENSSERPLAGAQKSENLPICEAVEIWLDVCEKEGRNGRDPVTGYTLKGYQRRAELIKEYPWEKSFDQLSTPDVVAFRSWLLRNYTRDLARKTLSSFHSVVREMVIRDRIASNIAAGISIRADSRYDVPVVIPTISDVVALLRAADRLAQSENKQTARTWRRYRPIMYLAADTGMRPQEYLALAKSNILDHAVQVERALERGGELSVTKTPAGRRILDLSPETYEMVRYYADNHTIANEYDLIFPTASGRWQETDNWRKRGFYAACIEAGLVDDVEVNGQIVTRPRFSPYDLRHFYASMLIENRVNLKKIQALMGHEDIKTTLNVYGHLLEAVENKSDRISMVQQISNNSCGKNVASQLEATELLS